MRPLHTTLLALLALAPSAAAGGALTSLVAAAPAPAGKVFMDRDEALELAFPGCAVERTTVYLDEEQVERIEALSKVEFEGSILYPYRALREGEVVGTAYFDTHRVRSKRETLMVVVGADGSVGRVEVLAFGEPVDYIPRDRWYGQFDGRPLDEDLTLGRKIRGVTGATLTAVATTECARRVLASHQVVTEAERRRREEEERRRREKEKQGDGPAASLALAAPLLP
jgi:hypothetical protein